MKLSVIVTAYKRPEKLDLTLASLRAQTRQPDELIVADDCSPDHMPEVAAKWRDEFHHFKYLRNVRNLNMPGNLNGALMQARGEYVANLHHADTFHPQLLEKWEKALDEHPTAGFVFCGAENRFDDRSRPTTVHLHSIAPFTSGREFFIRTYVGSLSGPIWGTVMARRRAYETLGPFDAAFGPWSDVDMWMRMCARFDVAYVREALLFLDMLPSEWRKYRWKRNLLHDRMVTCNIRRTFAHDENAVRRHLRTQRNHFRLRYWRSMAGRLFYHDWEEFRAGLPLFAQLYFTAAERDLVATRVDDSDPPALRRLG